MQGEIRTLSIESLHLATVLYTTTQPVTWAKVPSHFRAMTEKLKEASVRWKG